MDLGTVIVAFVLIAIAMFPFILSEYNRLKKNKAFYLKLTELAFNHNCNITKHEFCANFIAGIDEKSGYFFFYKKVDSFEISQAIDLKKFRSCRVLNTNRTVKHKKEHFYVIDKLELCFYPKRNNVSEILTEIYNNEHDSLTLSGELQVAEKWEKLLNAQMNKLMVPRKISPKVGIELNRLKTA